MGGKTARKGKRRDDRGERKGREGKKTSKFATTPLSKLMYSYTSETFYNLTPCWVGYCQWSFLGVMCGKLVSIVKKVTESMGTTFNSIQLNSSCPTLTAKSDQRYHCQNSKAAKS